MDGYTLVSTLNRGSYGTVQLVKHTQTGQLVAAKRVSLELSRHQEIMNEIEVHQRVQKHPRVVQLYDHFHDAETNEYVLLLEYCAGGDLHDRIARCKRPSPNEIRRIMLQLLDVVESCHNQGVYHRDIKPENIFLHSSGMIKLGDWGLATLKRYCTDFGTGSDQYMSPECFDPTAQTYDAAKADIWATGIVLLNYLFGRNPFKQATIRDPLFKDFASSRETLYDIFPTLTSDVFAILRHALTLNPDHRSIPKMREALHAVKNWSTDMEAEQIEQKARREEEMLRSQVVLEKTAAKMVPVVHSPFRVPTAVAQSLKSPGSATPWDRKKMYTPPTSRGSFWARRTSRPVLPRHLEQPEEEEFEQTLASSAPHVLLSSASSTASSASSTASTRPVKPPQEALGMFSMDDEVFESEDDSDPDNPHLSQHPSPQHPSHDHENEHDKHDNYKHNGYKHYGYHLDKHDVVYGSVPTTRNRKIPMYR